MKLYKAKAFGIPSKLQKQLAKLEPRIAIQRWFQEEPDVKWNPADPNLDPVSRQDLSDPNLDPAYFKAYTLTIGLSVIAKGELHNIEIHRRGCWYADDRHPGFTDEELHDYAPPVIEGAILEMRTELRQAGIDYAKLLVFLKQYPREPYNGQRKQ